MRGTAKSPSPKISPNGQGREATHITVRGARQHNLRDVDVRIPRDQMTVFCGPSGSGKTSLAMDTIYAEGQRRYVESLSSYARQFVGQMQKPQVDHIDGLSPAIAIEQRNTGHTPRSTVGTVTEIYDYFRILFARLGQPHCPECDIPIGTQTSDQIVDKLLEEPSGTKLYIMAPVEVAVGEQYEALWDSLRGGGYIRVRIDGETQIARSNADDRPPPQARCRSRRRPHRRPARRPLAHRRQHRKRTGPRQRRGPRRPPRRRRARSPLARHASTASTWPAKNAAAASTRSTRTISRSTARSVGAPRCEGLGTQIGANPAALLRDPNLTLAKGHCLVWPDVGLPSRSKCWRPSRPTPACRSTSPTTTSRPANAAPSSSAPTKSGSTVQP